MRRTSGRIFTRRGGYSSRHGSCKNGGPKIGDTADRRTEFVETVLDQAYEAGSRPVGFAVAPKPNTYLELWTAIVEDTIFTEDEIEDRDKIYEFLRLIHMSTERDEITRSLPYDETNPPGIWFVLPEPGIIEYFMTDENND